MSFQQWTCLYPPMIYSLFGWKSCISGSVLFNHLYSFTTMYDHKHAIIYQPIQKHDKPLVPIGSGLKILYLYEQCVTAMAAIASPNWPATKPWTQIRFWMTYCIGWRWFESLWLEKIKRCLPGTDLHIFMVFSLELKESYTVNNYALAAGHISTGHTMLFGIYECVFVSLCVRVYI